MKHKLALITIFILTIAATNAQTRTAVVTSADSLYNAKSYAAAAPLYIQAAEMAFLKVQKNNDYYNAACCFALIQDADNSFKYLRAAVDNGYNNLKHLTTDTDLNFLHTDKRWQKLTRSIPSRFSDDPYSSQIVTSDIKNFYKAFDQALKDTAKAKEIFREKYFKVGSVGLGDFYLSKIRDEALFAKTILENQKVYASVRSTLQGMDVFKKDIQASFVKFKEIYPSAVYPNTYFVIGRFNSGGTSSNNGLLIGTEVSGRTPATDTSGWSSWLKSWITNFSNIPITVSHELIHFNQNGMKADTTLLKYALFEGGAEFVCELISGKTDGDYAAFKGRELQVWADFKNEMLLNRYNDWLDAREPKRPRIGMYWAGYLIAKSYYEQAADKKAAVYDILNIKNYIEFFEKSRVDDYMHRTYAGKNVGMK